MRKVNNGCSEPKLIFGPVSSLLRYFGHYYRNLEKTDTNEMGSWLRWHNCVFSGHWNWFVEEIGKV